MRPKILALILLLFLGAPALGEQENFVPAVRSVLISEGGAQYTNHPKDPGGPTKWGITIWDVRRFIETSATAERVKALTEDEALAIYLLHYWDAVHAAELPRGLDYTVMDYGVNSGVSRVIKVLRRILGMPLDGDMTQEVLARVAQENPTLLINAINNEREKFLRSLHTYPIFGRGWSNRVHSVRLNSLRMANPHTDAGFTFRYIPRVGPHKAYEEGTE